MGTSINQPTKTGGGGSSKARAVSRDISGNVKFSQTGSKTATGLTTGQATTLTINATGKIMYDKLSVVAKGVNANITLSRNASKITGKTGVTTNVVTTGSPAVNSPAWTAKANINSTTPNSKTTKVAGSTYKTATYSGTPVTVTTTLTGTGNNLYAYEHAPKTNTNATISNLTISVNGSRKVNANITAARTTVKTALTGAYTSPKVTFKASFYYSGISTSPVKAYINNLKATLSSTNVLHELDFKASKNTVTTIT